MSTPDDSRQTTEQDPSMKRHGDPLLATAEGDPTEGSRHGYAQDQERAKPVET